MNDVDRIVASIVRSDVPLTRESVIRAAAALKPIEAPMAPHRVIHDATDAIVGLGPLEPVLRDPDVSDVLVNGAGDVWVERDGVLEKTDVTFSSDDALVAAVRRTIAPLGLRLDRAVPAVDARLPDGSRLHAIIPPASVDGPVVAIRRFVQTVSDLEDLVTRGAIPAEGADILGDAVVARSNILVVGGTGAGKTTILNLLTAKIDSGDRIVTIEDAAELSVAGHVVRLEAHPPNVEGSGEITIRSLVKHALRLRPDRIIVGEVRGPRSRGHDPGDEHRPRRVDVDAPRERSLSRVGSPRGSRRPTRCRDLTHDRPTADPLRVRPRCSCRSSGSPASCQIHPSCRGRRTRGVGHMVIWILVAVGLVARIAMVDNPRSHWSWQLHL